MNFKNIKINKDKNLGILKINRENFNNALDIETSQEILRGLKELESDKNINCIAIKGSSTFFSPGADIKELKDLNSKLAKKESFFGFDKPKPESLRTGEIGAIEGSLSLIKNSFINVSII